MKRDVKKLKDIFAAIEECGYKQQEKEAYCNFKIVLNNCRNTTLYFRKDDAVYTEGEEN